jgi:putative DNA primase/helicase
MTQRPTLHEQQLRAQLPAQQFERGQAFDLVDTYVYRLVARESDPGSALAHDCIGIVARYEDPRGSKTFRPFVLDGERLTMGAGRDDWCWLPYGIEEVSDRPGDTVWFVEGEKAARALQATGRLAVTTQGGAMGLKASDLRLLAGRRVIVWPDQDHAGYQYGRDVVRQLQTLGCDVTVIDPARVVPPLPDKGDAADWAGVVHDPAAELPSVEPERAAWWRSTNGTERANRSLLRAVASVTARRRRSMATDWTWGPLNVTAGQVEGTTDGVFFLAPDTDSQPGERTRLSDPLRLVAVATRDRVVKRVVEFRGLNGRQTVLLDETNRYERRGEFLRPLTEAGFRSNPSIKTLERLREAIYSCHDESPAQLVNRPGWTCERYIDGCGIQTGVIDDHGAQLFYDGDLHRRNWKRSGDLGSWQRQVAQPCEPFPILRFALAVAFAGALLGPTAGEPTIFHLCGRSSTGKSTAGHIAASVWSDDSHAGVYRSWRATGNGLEQLCMIHHDGFMVLDELDQIHPSELGGAIYMIANGEGKERDMRFAKGVRASDNKSWRLMVLSTGEVSPQELIERERGKYQLGHAMRMPVIPLDEAAGVLAGGPILATADASQLLKALANGARTQCGTAGREWIARLNADSQEGVLRDVLASLRAAILQALVCDEGSSQQRLRDRIVTVALAGELAIEHAILPWQKGAAIAACKYVWELMVDSESVRRADEDRLIVARVQRNLQPTSHVQPDDVYASSEELSRAVEGLWPAGRVAEALHRAGLLVPKPSGELAHRVRLDGAPNPCRRYRLNRGALNS